MVATLNSLIQSREGTEDPKQIIRPKIAIIAVNIMTCTTSYNGLYFCLHFHSTLYLLSSQMHIHPLLPYWLRYRTFAHIFSYHYTEAALTKPAYNWTSLQQLSIPFPLANSPKSRNILKVIKF